MLSQKTNLKVLAMLLVVSVGIQVTSCKTISSIQVKETCLDKPKSYDDTKSSVHPRVLFIVDELNDIIGQLNDLNGTDEAEMEKRRLVTTVAIPQYFYNRKCFFRIYFNVFSKY